MNFNNKKLSTHIVIYITLLSIFFATILFYIFSSLKCNGYSQILISPIVLLAYFAIYIWSKKYILKNNLLCGTLIFCVSLSIYAIWGLLVKTQPVSDYSVLIHGAHSVIDGTFRKLTFDKTNYFYFYNYQIGYVMLLSLIMKISGENIIVIKLLEIVVLSATNLLIYLILKNIYSSKISFIATMIYASLAFNIAGSSVINNQHYEMFFIIIGLYFLTILKKWYSVICCCLCFGVAMIIRQSALIVLFALIAFLLVQLIFNNGKEWGISLLSIILIILTFFSVTNIFDFSMKTLNIVPNSAIHGNLTYFKFVLGINHSGIFNNKTESPEKTQVYFDLKNDNFDYQLYNQQCKEYLIDKYTNQTRETMHIICQKMIFFSGSPDNQIEFSTDNTQYTEIMGLIGNSQYFLILLSCLVFVILSLRFRNKFYNEAGVPLCFSDSGYMPRPVETYKGKKIFLQTKNFLLMRYKNKANIFCMIGFILFFIVHLIIEAQPRYRYEQYLFLTVIASQLLYTSFLYLELLINKVLKK